MMQRAIIGKPTDPHPRIGKNPSLEKFLVEYRKIIPEKSLKYFLHGDYYPTNILLGGYVIDFEKKMVGDPMIDLAHFIEHPMFDGLNRGELIYTYVDQYKTEDKQMAIMEAYLNNYQFARIHTDICLVGAHLAQGNTEMAEIYVNKTVAAMEENKMADLREAFINYMKASEYENRLLAGI